MVEGNHCAKAIAIGASTQGRPGLLGDFRTDSSVERTAIEGDEGLGPIIRQSGK